MIYLGTRTDLLDTKHLTAIPRLKANLLSLVRPGSSLDTELDVNKPLTEDREAMLLEVLQQLDN